MDLEGAGDGNTAHREPSQRSVNVIGANTEPTFSLPTAKQLLAPAQAIPYSLLHEAFGTGTEDTFHAFPPNRSINGRYRWLVAPGAYAPAAKHSVTVGHEIPLN